MSRPTRAAAVLAVTALIGLTGAGTAWAVWTGAGTGTATVPGDTLPAGPRPTIGAVSGTSVPLSFTQVTSGTGAALTSYDVTRTRTSTGGTPSGALDVASACSTAGTTVSCTDSPSAGTYTYSVTARAGNWTGAPSAASASVTVTAADRTAPLVSVASPFAGQAVDTATPTISGLAGTATGDSSTVSVKVYAGTATTGTSLQSTTVTAAGGSWTWTPTALVNGPYTVVATQSDSAGNTGTSSPNAFTVSVVARTLDITDPADGASVIGLTPVFRGTATVPSPVTVTVYATDSTGAATGSALWTTSATQAGTTWTTPTYAGAALANGTLYVVRAAQSGATPVIPSVSHAFVTGIAPSPGNGIVLANTSALKQGVIDVGDTLTESYTIAVKPSTVYAGWSDQVAVGTALPSLSGVRISFTHTGSGSGSGDTITGATYNGAPIAIGTVYVKAGYLANSATSATATATLTLDATHRAVRLTLTSVPVDSSGRDVAANGTGSASQTAVQWTPPSAVTDMAGNHVPTALVPVVNQLAF